MQHVKRAILAVILSCGLVACAGRDNAIIGEVNDLYNQGMDQMQQGMFSRSITTFGELERQHPYSQWATRAKMMIAYSQFRSGQFDDAVATIDQFARFHPGHADLPYMLYLKGLSYYYRISDVSRDQGHTQSALSAFEEVIRRYPESRYARDAQLKVTLCRDHLAGQEMTIGRFYQQQGRYAAAINRFKAVIDEYDRTAQIPEALYRLTESYIVLGVPEEAQRAAAILGHNYPASDWYKRAYTLLTEKNLANEQPESWADTFMRGIKETF